MWPQSTAWLPSQVCTGRMHLTNAHVLISEGWQSCPKPKVAVLWVEDPQVEASHPESIKGAVRGIVLRNPHVQHYVDSLCYIYAKYQ